MKNSNFIFSMSISHIVVVSAKFVVNHFLYSRDIVLCIAIVWKVYFNEFSVFY